MIKNSKYIEELKHIILNSNKLSITEIKQIQYIKGVNFIQNEYDTVLELVKQKRIDDIKHLQEIKPKSFEDLSIFHFTDQNNQPYAGLIYDSDDPWQDPQLIAIYPI